MDKKLRGYQNEAVDSLLSAVAASEKDGLLCLPTGSGKTFTAMQFIKKMGDASVLWTAHREELLRQAEEEAQNLGLDVGWERDGSHDITLCPILSTRNLERRGYDILLIDEAVHTAAQSYQTLRNTVTHRYCLGMTATPERLDGKELGFSRIVYQRSFAELVTEGYLAKPKYYRLVTGMNANLRSRGGDFTRRSLMSLDEDTRNHLVVDWIVGHRDMLGRTILFTVSVAHGRRLEELLLEAGLPESTVKMMHGKSSRQERLTVADWVASTDNAIIVNCELYTEGLDLPTVRSVVLARPTASKALYQQMLGRGCRKTGGKDFFNIIDIVDMNDKYATLSAMWALDLEVVVEEGAEDIDRIVGELAEDDTRDRIRQVADEVGISFSSSAYKEARAEPLDFVAFLTYGSRYWQAHKTVAVNTDRSKAIVKLQVLIDQQVPVGATYALCCNEGEYDLQTWEKIAWAYVFRAVKRQLTFNNSSKNSTWKWAQLRENLTQQDMLQISDELTQAERARVDTNTMYAVSGGARRLWNECCNVAEERYGHSLTALTRYSPVSFKNMVFRASLNGTFRDGSRPERNFIKALLEEVTGYYIGLKVDYLQEAY